jgi:hypothetical protein
MQMTCKEAKRMVQPFIEGKLKECRTRAFLNHIKTCQDCRDELETYFVVNYSLRYLDNEKNNSYDIQKLLTERIERAEQELRLHRIFKILTAAVLALGILIVTLVALHLLMPETFPDAGRETARLLSLLRSKFS